MLLVTDGNKQAQAPSELVETFFSLLAADGRNSPELLPAGVPDRIILTANRSE